MANQEEQRDSSTKPQADVGRLRVPLETWLSQQWPGAQRVQVDDLRAPSASGYSGETVFFRARWNEGSTPRQRRLVLRSDPQESPVYPQQTETPWPSVEVQYRAMEAVRRAGGGPIAALVGFEPSKELLGGPFFVMEFVEGEVPGDTPLYTQQGFFVDAAPHQRRRLVESGLSVLAGLHTIDWRAAGLDWLAPSGSQPGLGRQFEVYRRHAEQELRGREHTLLQEAFRWLERGFPGEGGAGLSWGDSRPGNMIFASFECAAVTDWEAVALGPPELDLGWWLMFDRFAHEGAGTGRLEGDPTREEQRAFYAQQAGRDVSDTHYYEVFAAMRLAVAMIHTGDRLTAAGTVPVSMNLGIHNPGTQVLADLLGIKYAWLSPGS
jgi:aminoglycoside phosphotransferase (APT) family kinase protein